MAAEHDELSHATVLKIVAVFVVLISGILGSAAPVVFAYFSEGESRTTRRVLKILTCVAIGLILATAMIHMLPEGILSLQESGNPLFKEDTHAAEDDHHDEKNATTTAVATTTITAPAAGPTTTTADAHDDHDDDDGHAEHPYPFGFLFATISLLVVYFISTELNWYQTRKLKELKGVECDEKEEERQGAMIKLYIMEAGVFVHSIIIGITLGVSSAEKTARVLTIVLCFHQFFEGLAIGALCVVAQVTMCQAIWFVLVFALSTPVGIAIGIGVADDHDLVTQGVLSTLSGGILLHAALVEMLPHALGSHSHHAHGPLPLAKIHDHLHHHHDHDHHHEPDQQMNAVAAGTAASPAPTAIEASVVSKPAESEEDASTAAASAAAAKDDGEAASSPRQPVAGEHTDDHEDDTSFGFRFLCYTGLVVGASIQAVLGMWA